MLFISKQNNENIKNTDRTKAKLDLLYSYFINTFKRVLLKESKTCWINYWFCPKNENSILSFRSMSTELPTNKNVLRNNLDSNVQKENKDGSTGTLNKPNIEQKNDMQLLLNLKMI